jgi:diaminohydroxyphosphoribosylaminopyrimidine deaminase/5-amino-6-(5-phosphoribosylamino)uracil reductase
MELKLPSSLKIFNDKAKTIVFNKKIHQENNNIVFYQVTEDVSLVHQITNALYQSNILSVIVEGGSRLLQSFIDEKSWDEARVITNEELIIDKGLPSPELEDCRKMEEQKLLTDKIEIFKSSIFLGN